MTSLVQARGPKPRNGATDEIPALTGVRGVAACLVALYHAFHPLMPAGSVVLRLFGRGYLYVDLFFVLSGYVMALNYGAMFSERVRRTDIVSFFWKRFARIYPLYIVITLALIAAQCACWGDFADHHAWIGTILPHPARDISLNVLLMQAWGYGGQVVGQAWSVSTEAAAYLYFPLLALLCARWRPRGIWLAVAASFAAIPLAVWLARSDGLYHAGTLDLWAGPPALLRCFGGFSIGVCLFRIASWPRARFAFSDAFGFALLAADAALLLVAAPDLALYPVFPLLILCLAGNRGRFAVLFGCRPVYVLGLLSYSLYLTHVYFIPPMYHGEALLAHSLPGWLAWIVAGSVAAATMLGVCTAAYLGIEKPARRLLRRATSRSRRRPVPSGGVAKA